VTIYPTFTCPGGYGTISGIGTVTSGGSYSLGALTAASGGGYQAYSYTLTSYNGANCGSYYAQSNVTIYCYPLPTAALTLSPDYVDSGGTTTLYPVFANGTGSINQSVGAVTSGASYVRTLTGDAFITYTLTCTSPTGATATASASVTVTTGCPSDGVCPRDGICPAPEVLVLMADGTQRQAGNLVVGDLLQSWNEKFSRFDIEEVTALERGYNERSRIFFSNGLSGLFSSNHRLLLANGEWKEIRDMVSGEMLHGDIYVLGHGPEGIGEVVKITISNLHTYVTLGVISHNLKIPIT